MDYSKLLEQVEKNHKNILDLYDQEFLEFSRIYLNSTNDLHFCNLPVDHPIILKLSLLGEIVKKSQELLKEVLVLVTDNGKVGAVFKHVNLVFQDAPFRPLNEKYQSEDRIHRIGAKNANKD